MVQRQSSSATCTKELNPNELNRLLLNFKILLLLVQTAFTVHIWQSIGALVDSNNEDVPTLQKMQMVHYAMGFTTFTTRWIHLLNSGWVEKLGKHCSALLWGTTRALASSGGSTSGTVWRPKLGHFARKKPIPCCITFYLRHSEPWIMAQLKYP